jgi:hypothetical protein
MILRKTGSSRWSLGQRQSGKASKAILSAGVTDILYMDAMVNLSYRTRGMLMNQRSQT